VGEPLVAETIAGTIPVHAAVTMGRALSGFLLATLVGRALGYGIARFRALDMLIEPMYRRVPDSKDRTLSALHVCLWYRLCRQDHIHLPRMSVPHYDCHDPCGTKRRASLYLGGAKHGCEPSQDIRASDAACGIARVRSESRLAAIVGRCDSDRDARRLTRLGLLHRDFRRQFSSRPAICWYCCHWRVRLCTG
jgi:hypothetical protein